VSRAHLSSRQHARWMYLSGAC